MRRWSEIAERVAATTKTSEKTAILADYLASPDARRAADRGRVPHRPAVPRDRPADDRVGLVGASAARSCGSRPPTPTRCAAPTTARRDVATAVAARCSTEAGPRARPGRRADAARGRGGVRGDRGRSGRGRQGGAARGAHRAGRRRGPRPRIVKVLTGELRIGLREGLLEAALAKAFDRPLDAVKRAGMLTGDIGRTATLAREDRLGEAALDAVPPAQVHARVAGRGRRGDHRPARAHRLGRGQVRRHPRPAPPAPATRSASTRATSTTSAGSSPRSWTAPAGCRGPGSSTASSSPGATASCCRSSSSRRGSGARTRRRRSSRRSR